MRGCSRQIALFVFSCLVLILAPAAAFGKAEPAERGKCCRDGAQGAEGEGGGCGQGGGQRRRRGAGGPGGKRAGQPEGHAVDQEVFHFLLDHHDEINRGVTMVEGGVETLTESDNPEVVAKIKEHVHAMAARVEESRPIRQRDPLFVALFQQADKIEISIEETEKGVRVRETSDDPTAAKLIQAHAGVVSKFVADGHEEARKNHSADVSGAQE